MRVQFVAHATGLIEVNDMWKEILTYTFTAIGGSAAFFAIAGYFFKKIINNVLDKDIEKYKAVLTHQNDSALEELKTSLKIEEIRFNKLHEKQACVIADLYSKAATVLNHSKAYFSTVVGGCIPSKDEISKELSDVTVDFMTFFNKHRIYLSESTCNKIIEFDNKLYKHIVGFSFARRWAKEDSYDQEAAKQMELEEFRKGLEALKQNGVIETILKDLESDFRKLLGVK